VLTRRPLEPNHSLSNPIRPVENRALLVEPDGDKELQGERAPGDVCPFPLGVRALGLDVPADCLVPRDGSGSARLCDRLGRHRSCGCRVLRAGALGLHLLLGDPGDACCQRVRSALEVLGCSSQVIANPLAHPSRLSWWLETERSRSTLTSNGQKPLRDEEIDGVLVLGAGWIDPSGWRPDDLTYMQSETHAALLAWLWSLQCPVVNRYPPAIWYRPQAPLLSWHGLLQRSGLQTLRTLVTNVADEARAFGRLLAADGPDGVVYGALTSEARYLVTSEDDWRRLAALQRVTPVCLSAPHGEAQRICVVGDRVVWDGDPAPKTIGLEPALREFATTAGLACVELALAPTAQGVCVVAVETQPRLEHFGDCARKDIVGGLAELLTAKPETSHGRMRHGSSESRS